MCPKPRIENKKNVYQRVKFIQYAYMYAANRAEKKKNEALRRKSTVYARDARDAEMGEVHASCSLN